MRLSFRRIEQRGEQQWQLRISRCSSGIHPTIAKLPVDTTRSHATGKVERAGLAGRKCSQPQLQHRPAIAVAGSGVQLSTQVCATAFTASITSKDASISLTELPLCTFLPSHREKSPSMAAWTFLWAIDGRPARKPFLVCHLLRSVVPPFGHATSLTLACWSTHQSSVPWPVPAVKPAIAHHCCWAVALSPTIPASAGESRLMVMACSYYALHRKQSAMCTAFREFHCQLRLACFEHHELPVVAFERRIATEHILWWHQHYIRQLWSLSVLIHAKKTRIYHWHTVPDRQATSIARQSWQSKSARQRGMVGKWRMA